MSKPIRVLLQTTIPAVEDDWHIGRFSLLADHLRSLTGKEGRGLCEVTARNREVDAAGNVPILSKLDQTDFDQLLLFALDNGDGLTVADCQGITRFRQRGGGILSARDHQDMGSSLCRIMEMLREIGVPYGSRTRVAAVKEKRPVVIQCNFAAWIALYRT